MLVLPHFLAVSAAVLSFSRAKGLRMVAEAPSPARGAATLLSCRGLAKAHTETPQFRDVSFNLGRGQRVGLVGVNGAGKSSLLRVLAGLDAPDAGEVEVASSAKVVLVDQEPRWDDAPVYAALFPGLDERSSAIRNYLRCTDPALDIDSEAFTAATDAMARTSAWELQERGVETAAGLGVGDKLYRACSSLSGGELRRVGLAAALVRQPEVLLLDEPTNHLDIDALEWLAERLLAGDLSLLLVTHDRSFLDRVCTEILELDRASLHRYPGGYSKYLELKAARLAAEDAETERARVKLRREAEWMKRQPRARQAKSKAREQQFYELSDRAKGRSPASKALELQSPEDKERQRRLGGVVAEFRGAGFSLEQRTLLRDFTYDFRQRDRICIVGNNGVGKSTFLRVLTGELPLSAGSLRVGETVRFGYYAQQGLRLSPEQEVLPVLKFIQEAIELGSESSGPEKPDTTVRAVVSEDLGRRKRLAGKESTVTIEVQDRVSASSAVSERDAMFLLSRFQFPKQRLYDRVGQLSGGERRRLQLLQVLAKSPNVLVLDEPTNDLDLQTLSSLEEYLTESFDGCLVVVSHDSYFVNRVAEHLFVFEGEGLVRDFQGSYSEYLNYRLERRHQQSLMSQAERANNLVSQGKTVEKVPRNYSTMKEINKLEREMEKLEKEISLLEERLYSEKGYSLLAELTAKQNQLREQLAAKEERWLELNDS